MEVKDVIGNLQDTTGLSLYEISRISGVPQSTLSRMAHGKTDPTLSTMQRLLTPFGITMKYEYAGSPAKRSGTNLGRLIASINAHPTVSNEGWERISAALRTLLEFPDQRHPSLISACKRTTAGKEWEAFLAGLFIHLDWIEAKSELIEEYKLSHEWTPLPRTPRSALMPAPDFAQFNVLIPEGELRWI
jgi:transcriptional regulator with XRE-family HTH domain